MNTSHIKKVAPKARLAFIGAVTKRLNELGIYSDEKITEATEQGGLLSIDGKHFDVSIKPLRNALVAKAKATGVSVLSENVAYTWFNRLCALRYMELHDYLDHGFRVLSHPEKDSGFEILDRAQDVADQIGLNRNHIIELKLAGNKDETLYRELLIGQCHQLHKAMPFLFEALDDETELLLPDNLTRTDSILRALVNDIPEEDWQQVEVIGWLYQFYISEKKDQVIGKVVKSEDIPAATQLFTPNWIVKYLVQNSVGRQWLQTYPDSSIKSQMEYYIEPAEQSDEVNAQLKAITPDSIAPESIKVLDPACGSGHILVEAYQVLKAIYEERGYRSRDIPQLILENNLFGLDIDDRAAQLAGFALMMLARADDRRIFTRDISLNVLSIQESKTVDLELNWRDLNLDDHTPRSHAPAWECRPEQADSKVSVPTQEHGNQSSDSHPMHDILQDIWTRFEQGKTFGSLVDIPAHYEQPLTTLLNKLNEIETSGEFLQRPAASSLKPIIRQAWILAQRYDAVVANPPYMGSKGMNAELKKFAKDNYPNSKSDLFAIFMEHAFSLLKETGFNAQINMQSWMFLSSYEKMREWLLDTKTFVTMAHLGARAFSQISGEVVQTNAWVLNKKHLDKYQPVFFRLIEGNNEEEKQQKLLKQENRFDSTQQDDFKKIPGSPIAYWVSDEFRSVYEQSDLLSKRAHSLQGMITGDNNKFLRLWQELSFSSLSLNKETISDVNAIESPWIPYNKGGSVRKWYGNNEYVLNWSNEGNDLTRSRTQNSDYYFKPCVTWTFISSSFFASRYCPNGYVWDVAGSSAFPICEDETYIVLSLMSSPVGKYILDICNPTLNYQVENILALPLHKDLFLPSNRWKLINNTKRLVELAKMDWDSQERSWDFKKPYLLTKTSSFISKEFKSFIESGAAITKEVNGLEIQNMKVFSSIYPMTLQEIPEEHITLSCNSLFRYKSDPAHVSLYTSDSMGELISYSLGCMMGRYSLDREGLIYAHSGNEGFTDLVTEGAYKTFPADDDGIIPLTDQDWFADDATNRFREFVRVVWGEEHLQQNLDFVAESLCLYAIKPLSAKGGSESSLQTIRRYLSNQFYKDHLKTYKKRPIYWLFSSGKQKAFECLVYLHRYNEGTLARMRTEYVTPLLGKYDAYSDQLQKQMDDASSTAEANRLKKQQTALQKKQNELREFDDKLKHYADMRISIDLDDGVKVNYGKFGDLLTDVKAITRKK